MTRLFLPLFVIAALLPGWQHVGGACSADTGAAIVQACESGGYYGPPIDLAGGVHVEADVLATPAADGRFWAGMALNADIAADNRYAEVAIEQGIAPFWGDMQPYGVQLTTTWGDDCCERLTPIDVGAWHHLSIDYAPGQAIYIIDGVQRAARIDLGPRASVELLCVAVDPGESRPGNVATCEWRNMEIRQQQPAAPPPASASWNFWEVR